MRRTCLAIILVCAAVVLWSPALAAGGDSYAPAGQATWLELGEGLALAQQDRSASDAASLPAGAGKQPWELDYTLRRGPAYPGDVWRTFVTDAKEFPGAVWHDTKAVFTDPTALTLLGVSGVAGIVINSSKLDRRVSDHYHKYNADLNTFWDMVGDVGGNPGLHFAAAGVMYFYGSHTGDTKTYEVGKTLLNGLSINGLLTLGLKGIVRTRSPNGDIMGWPSGHTSSTFTLATILYKSYGPWVGVPAMAFAGFVGYERFQARNHDFSDVISGALIGIAVGYVVSNNHEMKVFGMDVIPYADPSRGAIGVALVKTW